MLHLLDDWPNWKTCDQRPNAGQIEVLPGGLTNQSFILHLTRDDYVLRVEAGNSQELGIQRDTEYLIHQQAALLGLVPKILYRSCGDNKYWIRRYITGEVLQRDTLSDAQLSDMTAMLTKLHQVHADERIPRLSVSGKAARYWFAIQQRAEANISQDLQQLFVYLQQQLAAAPNGRLCICHMDPTLGNWIASETGLQLVDWEYAALGHPLWDLAMMVQGAQLNSRQQALVLQRYYGSQRYDRYQWQYAQTQMKYLTALWNAAQGVWSLRQLEAYLMTLRAVDL